ncbi:chromatin structure-remodeling complex protein RSC7 [Pseudohyphozyma bogoriensis]|nr:chromatin structure-remodeling complex protein RSC7 [Pseudohyphozyma bogoriensis]
MSSSGSEYHEDSDDESPHASPARASGRTLTLHAPSTRTRGSDSRATSHDDDEEDDDGDDNNSQEGSDDQDEDDDEEPGPSEADEGDPEPAELDLNDLDPINSAINSGAATPAVNAVAAGVPRNKAAQFVKRKETKIIKGQTYTIIDDEIILPEDERGEAKIDADGNLLGGRAFKVATFTSPLRPNPNKLYMLSIDAARASGFRDSLYFFRRNPLIHKLSCNQAEKDRLIELGKLSTNLKSRAVTMVSAKNCFKVMGAQFVLNEDKALQEHKPGEPAYIESYDPEKDSGTLAAAKGPRPAGATDTGVNLLLTGSGKPRSTQPDLRTAPKDDFNSSIGGGMNSTFGGTGFQPFGKTWDPAAKKARPAAHLTVENWMHEYAKAVQEGNKELRHTRQMNVGQVQVGLNVVEREEDKFVEVEEEVTDDEAMEVDTQPSASLPLPFPPPVEDPAIAALKMESGAAPSPRPESSTSRTTTPAPKKRKLIKVYNPIRGVYDPETNVPHVYASTQPTKSEVERVDLVPNVFGDSEEVGEKERAKRRRGEERLGRRGLATTEFVLDEGAFGWSSADLLVPGMWDFRKMEEDRQVEAL